MADSPESAGGKARRLRVGIGLGVAIVLVAALAMQDPPSADDGSMARPTGVRLASTAAASGHGRGALDDERRAVLVARLARALATPGRRGAFLPLDAKAAAAWGPPMPASAPPGPALVAETPPQEAPEAPFQWIGRWEQPAAVGAAASAPPLAILSNDTRTWVVKPGDIVSLDWKIERIDADRLELLHLPTSLRRALSLDSR